MADKFTYEEHEEAFKWASGLSTSKLHWMVTVLASDLDSLHPLNTKAVLEVVALRLGAEARKEQDAQR